MFATFREVINLYKYFNKNSKIFYQCEQPTWVCRKVIQLMKTIFLQSWSSSFEQTTGFNTRSTYMSHTEFYVSSDFFSSRFFLLYGITYIAYKEEYRNNNTSSKNVVLRYFVLISRSYC